MWVLKSGSCVVVGVVVFSVNRSVDNRSVCIVVILVYGVVYRFGVMLWVMGGICGRGDI